MPVSSWSTNPDLNTSVGGVFIGENCPPSNVNNGERQIMAEAKAKFDALDAATGGASVAGLGALTPAANKFPYFTGPTTAGLGDTTAFGRSIMAAADAAAVATLLGAVRVASFTPGTQGVLSLLIGATPLILQWGTYSGSYSEGSQFIPFNVTFPSACWRVFPTAINSTGSIGKDIWTQEGPMTASGFTATFNWVGSGSNSIDGAGWAAIGG